MSKDITKPCVKCGACERNKTGHCLLCARANSSAWHKKNREYTRAYKRAAYHADPARTRAATAARYWADPAAHRARAMDYYRAHPEKLRAQRLRKYNLSEAAYARALTAQGGLCAICRKPETVIHKKSGKAYALAVDHSHVTRKVRELLCTKCNQGLGSFRDDPALLLAAAAYLEKHKNGPTKSTA